MRVGVLLFLGLAMSACPGNACQDEVDRQSSCGWTFRDASCGDPQFACQMRCFRSLSCSELSNVYGNDADLPPRAEHCMWECASGFACDGQPTRVDVRECNGFVECVDGTDERNCNYFECTDGQRVARSAPCDGFDDCMDGSDEETCP